MRYKQTLPADVVEYIRKEQVQLLRNLFSVFQKTLTLGLRDIGFGITASDRTAKDMIELYRLA